jgi:hypothetical protein
MQELQDKDKIRYSEDFERKSEMQKMWKKIFSTDKEKQIRLNR